MKKNFTKIIFTLIVIVLAFTFTACDEISGASAYELAVNNGFSGTEQEWLDSLVKTVSAYDIAVENGFIGTEDEWLNSLKGEKGDRGDNGNDGEDGVDGVDGEDGQDGLDKGIENIDFDSYVFARAVKSAVKIVSSHVVNVYNMWGSVTGTKNESYTGAGVFYRFNKETGDAYIITNYHVVYHKNSTASNKIGELKVYIYGKEQEQYAISAEYIGGAMNYDIAVLKVSGSDILKNSDCEAVTLAEEDVKAGQRAVAVGNPLSEGLAVSSGIINVDSETLEMNGADDVTPCKFRVMRIDTPVNGGNSGGGLFNSHGELIGIVNAKSTDTKYDNVGYAIPMTVAVNVAENILYNCDGKECETVKTCVLGISIGASESKAVYNNNGVSIVEVIKVLEEPEETALVYNKLFLNDIILSATLDDKNVTINRIFKLGDLILLAKAGDTISIKVVRNDVETDVDITFTEENFQEIF